MNEESPYEPSTRSCAREDRSGISRRELLGAMGAAAAFSGTTFATVTADAAVSSATSADASQRIANLLNLEQSSYPPLRQGLRGQYPGSFESVHSVRDGAMHGPLNASETGEHYDLVVVGSGFSGLASAYLYQKALGKDKRVLILDTLDDFGGHAKRNEFHLDGRVYLGIGGSMNTHSPFPYSQTALSILAELGVDPTTYRNYSKPEVLDGLVEAVFYNKENFGKDKLVAGYGTKPWNEFFAAAPLSARARSELTRLFTEKVDYMPDLNPTQKALALQRISYRDFLTKHAKLSDEAVKFFDGSAWRNNKRADACPAYEIAALFPREPGFSGMQVAAEPKFDSKVFMFPDGNASVARLFINRLIPEVFQGTHDMESIILARANYAALDLPSNSVRVRLSSPVVRVEHTQPKQDIFTEKAVRVVYLRDGQPVSVTAGNAIMACFNSVVRYVVPEVSKEQGEAESYGAKVPLVATNVLVRNWKPWKQLGVRGIQLPHGYNQTIRLSAPIAIGGYESVGSPDEPVVLAMLRNPNFPGINRKDQNRAGRAELLGETPEQMKSRTLAELDRVLGSAGFDSTRDVVSMTINRWAHGYAYTPDPLNDPDLPDSADTPNVIGRKPLGRIAIANSDAAASAFMNTAIDQALRAVSDCFISRGLI